MSETYSLNSYMYVKHSVCNVGSCTYIDPCGEMRFGGKGRGSEQRVFLLIVVSSGNRDMIQVRMVHVNYMYVSEADTHRSTQLWPALRSHTVHVV